MTGDANQIPPRIAPREALLPGGVILLGLVLVFRGDLLTGSDFFFKCTRDINPFLLWYPWSRLAAASWSQGLFPLWNPDNFLGLPLCANYQSAVFSPLLSPLYLSLEWVTAPYLVGRLWLAGMGAWWLGRRVGQCNPAATVAGVAFGLTGYLVQHVSVQHVVIDLCLPYLFIAGMELLDRPRLRSFLLLSGVTALVLLGGQPGAALFTLYFGYLYLVLHALTKPGRRLRGYLMLKAAGSVAALVAMTQLLPFFEFIPQAWTFHLPSFGSEHIPRAGAITAIAAGFYGPLDQAREALTSVNPSYTLVHLAPYVGMTVVVLALTAAFRPRRLFDGWLVVCLVIGGSILFGIPPLCWLTRLPGIGQLTFIKYLQPILAFSLALLAGRGVDDIASGKAATRALAAGALMGAVITFLLYFPGHLSHVELDIMPNNGVMLGIVMIGAELSAVFFIGSILVIVGVQEKSSRPAAPAAAALLGLVVIDLVMASTVNRPLMSRNVAREDFSPVREAIAACTPPGSLIPPRAGAAEDVLVPNINLVVPYSDLGGGEALIPTPSFDLIRAITGETEEQFQYRFLKYNSVTLPPGSEKNPLAPAAGLGATLSRRDGGVDAHCAASAPARIYLAREVIPGDDLPAMAARLQPGVAFVAAPAPPLPAAGGTVTRVDYGQQRVRAEVAPSGPGMLVLADAYFPGWRAYVDGREERIIRTNHAVRGVAVAADSRAVEFVYQPWAFRIGLWLCLASLAMALAVHCRGAALLRPFRK